MAGRGARWSKLLRGVAVLKSELTDALAVARDEKVSLLEVDASALHGLYLPTFKAPVTTTRLVVAKMLRELVVNFNGTVDAAGLAEFGRVARHRVLVVG